MNKIKKQKILLGSICLILGITTIFMTSKVVRGYLTAEDELPSEDVGVQGVNIQINQNYDPSIMYQPGGSVTREPWVTNIGDVPCYIRMRADINDGMFAKKAVTIDFNTDNWSTKQEDGYYYYKGVISPCTCDRTAEDYDATTDCLANHHRTENLFNEVSIAEIDDDEITNFYIYLYAEAIPIESLTDLYSNPIEGWSLYCNREANNPIVINDNSYDFSKSDAERGN